MSVLKAYFDKTVNQYSPSRGDDQRVVNYDKEGNEFITYESIDYPALVASRGSVSDWSLDALLKAGIDPKFTIHTGLSTRLQGVDVVSNFEDMADEILQQMEDLPENDN